MPLLEVTDLVTAFDTEDHGRLVAVDGVSFEVEKGGTLGIVGESGCGKSVTALSVTQLLPQPAGKILGGRIRFKDRDLVGATPETLYDVRGDEIGMIFQEPMTALNPVHRIGRQVSEVFRLHKKMGKKEAWDASIDVLRKVGIPAPEIRVTEYPHQLSGGMRQRVMIAIALGCKPDLLIADEPTTALDVTVQAQILKLMKDLQAEMGMAIILITHDLGVIAETCDEVVVMYAGRVVERAPAGELFANPRHAYTRGLLRSIPRLDRERKTKLPIIEGNVPPLEKMPAGCRFSTRAPKRHDAAARDNRPPYVEISPGHWVEKCPFCHETD
ncbi:MAG: ABC transporter ATP-binding protein [Akkermansiaceae bacterium]|nr:ABC transporter ATP-binding protein [Akkermansiaceae bacterium]